MPAQTADRNLLFGFLALQNDFIAREELIAAVSVWLTDKSRSLEDIFRERRALADDEQQLIAALVKKHLERHGGDPEKSLANLSSVSSVREELRKLGDAEIETTLIPRSDRAPAANPQLADTLSVDPATAEKTRFRIVRPHAKGGLGQVFVAKDLELNREVALKEIQLHRADDPDSRSRFVLEAEITGGLEHPGIVPVYGLGQYADGRPFYAMRFIRGDSLKEAIHRFHHAGQASRPTRNVGQASRLPPKPSVSPSFDSVEFRILLGRFIDVCNAIEYAHSRGVLHRDLKPGNIMLGKYGETLVVDWGLAKVAGKDEQHQASGEQTLHPRSCGGSAPTQTGAAIGTPAYMSPEQAAGRLDLLGPASDVYALGATLFSVLTGRLAFSSGDTGEVLRKVQAGDFARPRQLRANLPKPLEVICLKAMALRPADRYASPQALADDLERFLADEPVHAHSEPVTLRARRWLRKHPRSVAALAASLLVGATSAIVIAAIVTGMNRQLGAANNGLQAANVAERMAKNEAEKKQQEAELSRQSEERSRQRAERAEATARANELQASAEAKRAEEEKRIAQHFVAAYGRTLLQLPREDIKTLRTQPQYFSTLGELFDRPDPPSAVVPAEDHLFATLAELVDRYDPQGLSDDPSLLMVGGWVFYRRSLAQNEQRLQMGFLADSLRRAEKLERITATDDRFRIRSLSLSAASDRYVKAAFWTPIRSNDEAQPELSDSDIAVKDPLIMTKYELLRRAVALGQLAQVDKERRLPEEAFVTEGNALEDLGWYYKLIENYAGAARAFETAANLTGPLRSNAYALTCKGRCEYRWSRDAGEIDADVNFQRAKFRDAQQSLRMAIDRATDDERHIKAEAKFWLGHTIQASASLERETETRLAMMQEAWQEIVGAAEIAKAQAVPESTLYLLEVVRLAQALAYPRGDAATNPDASRRAALAEIVQYTREILQLAKEKPNHVSPGQAGEALMSLARAQNSLSGREAALASLTEWEPLFVRGETTDVWRAQLVSNLLLKASYGDHAAQNQANSLALTIDDPLLNNQSLARCRQAEADKLYRERVAPFLKDPAKISAVDCEHILRLYIDFEKRVAHGLDPQTLENLLKLKKLKVSDIQSGKFEREINKFAAFRLRSAIGLTLTVQHNAWSMLTARLNLFLKELAPQYQTRPFSPEAEAIARPLFELTKLLLFYDREETVLKDKSIQLRFLQILERKLDLQ
jgi:serine/threonine protein kinase